MSFYENWVNALLNPEQPAPAGLKSWNGSDPAKRFAVYRNNVAVSLINALAETFPVTKELVGEGFFNTMAREFVYQSPPHSPRLVCYGGHFPTFIAHYLPAKSLPYLADVARLEFAYVQAYHASDAEPLSANELQDCLANKDAVAAYRFILHPSLRTMQSRYPIVSLWAAHQGHGNLSDVHADAAESCWILRCGLQGAVLKMSGGDCQFVESLNKGATFAQSADDAMRADQNFDLTACLAVMIREGVIVAVEEYTEL